MLTQINSITLYCFSLVLANSKSNIGWRSGSGLIASKTAVELNSTESTYSHLTILSCTLVGIGTTLGGRHYYKKKVIFTRKLHSQVWGGTSHTPLTSLAFMACRGAEPGRDLQVIPQHKMSQQYIMGKVMLQSYNHVITYSTKYWSILSALEYCLALGLHL